MKKSLALLVFCFATFSLMAQDAANWLSFLPQAKDYVQHRSSATTAAAGLRMHGRLRRERR